MKHQSGHRLIDKALTHLWILVDGPRGNDTQAPGRMKSIYTAANLAKKHQKTHIFVHDCDRDVESIYSGYFISNKYLLKKIEKLNHYLVTTAEATQ
ncbi:hypothetical protein [Limnospira platensis]|uniref:hypothetical protein n=1 Tax=Limnospira platensis TaxID=118562 RepID=UPI003D6F71BB